MLAIDISDVIVAKSRQSAADHAHLAGIVGADQGSSTTQPFKPIKAACNPALVCVLHALS
jgi:hypothetical protein